MWLISDNKNNKTRHTTLTDHSVIIPIVLCLSCAGANAQTVDQLFDTTYAYGVGKAVEMTFDDASQDYVDRGITGSEFNTCKLTALGGLFCLDGKVVRNWPNPARQIDPGDGSAPFVASLDVVDCRDAALGLDTKKETCTGMTVDYDGNVWLAGKNKGKTHSLIKLVKSEASPCPEAEPGITRLTDSPLEYADDWCAYEFATGRPLLVDIAPVDGTASEAFGLPGYPAPRKAIIGLEERKTAVAFFASGEVVEVVSDKKVWGLSGPESLLGITLLQLTDESGTAATKNIFLVATSIGRILAYDAATESGAWQVFDAVGMRSDATLARGTCNSDEPVFSVRASGRTNTVFVTDSEYCEVLALQPGVDAYGDLTLVNVTTEPSGNLAISTAGTLAPTGVTVAAGTKVDLSDCGDEPCPLAFDEGGAPIATLSGVQLVDETVSGLTLFQVDGMLDCRYVPHTCLDLLGIDSTGLTTAEAAEALIKDPGEADAVSVIVPLLPHSGDRLNPAAQRLNVTPMMPAEISDLFPGGMPDLLLPRYIRAQAATGFRFGGFFGRTEDGVVFRDNFLGEFDVGELNGSSLGCADNLGTLLWDVIATVSERYASANDDYAISEPLHLATITNSGCRNPTRTLGERWSFKPYGLEPTPCTFNPDPAGNWSSDGSCDVRDTVSDGSDIADDAVYGKMILVLIDELDRTVDQLACNDTYNENGGVAPLSAANCSFVQAKVLNATDKFYKCWDATLQPKQSSGDQNCQAFDSQLVDLENTLGQISPVGTDVANRLGELKARVARLRHILEARFAPSVPAGGFDDNTQ